ncbi:hypothetical protein K4B79_07430 [Streptomyces lincolnensis]|uniref:hypothetical protein n=1 Tax=Streptomyces lincolnensis TaxID=1915 RepID=UPI001E584FAE|nr:hypothetical protein [Streptomyces lincolnensis]MCD7438060.1 hypothetical protein [Streptomyces lincolnensis]
MRAGVGAVAVAVLVAMAVVGCGEGIDEDMVVAGEPPAAPYGGPLYLPMKEVDESGERAVLTRSGAAGRALECEGEAYAGSSGEEWSRADAGESPEEGLKAYFDMEQPEVPRTGYRLEAERDGRVLYSFDVNGRTKVAVVVAEDRKGRPGWGPEASASCDPAELPASFTDSWGTEIWTDATGKRIPVTTVHSSLGPEHCDWQSARMLHLGRGRNAEQFVRDPEGVFERDLLTGPYDGDVRMPDDARDTGYRLDDRELWLTDDRTTAYVRTPDGVEAWPRTKDVIACM